MSFWEYTETELWRHGEGGIALYHVFGLISFGRTVLAFAEARRGEGKDADDIHDIVLRRSEDGGHSFAPSVTLIPGEGGRCLTNPTPVYDAETEKLFLFYCENFGNSRTENYVTESADGGRTWSRPRALTRRSRTPSMRCEPTMNDAPRDDDACSGMLAAIAPARLSAVSTRASISRVPTVLSM